MGLNVAQTAGDFEIVPEGQYVARCYRVIDLGTQSIEYMGEQKQQHKVLIYWEILDKDAKMDDGRPFSVSRKYTASLDERSHLYSDLVAWRGKTFTQEELLGFDISKLLGAYCTLQIVHNESNNKTYANVNAIMSTKERPEGVNPLVMFDIDNPDMEVFEGLSDWIKDQIRNSQEWQVKDMAVNVDVPKDDDIDPKDIPF
jgi:hypothetical protein